MKKIAILILMILFISLIPAISGDKEISSDTEIIDKVDNIAVKGGTFIEKDGKYEISKGSEYKTYTEPQTDGKWFTMGSDTFKFKERPMYVELISQSPGHLKFDITPNDGNHSGQPIQISKKYLEKNSIFNPSFENGDGFISFDTEKEYYIFYPTHFSPITIHEVATGEIACRITADGVTEKAFIQQNAVTGTNAQAPGENPSQLVMESDINVITNVTLNLGGQSANIYIIIYNINDSDDKVISNTINNDIYPGTNWYNISFPYHYFSPYTNMSLNISFDGWTKLNYSNLDPYANGSYNYLGATNGKDLQFRIYGYNETHYGQRYSGALVEYNWLNTTANTNFYTNTILKIPVSDDITAITAVRNVTSNELATSVNTSSDLINNTYWFDVANKYVWIRTANISSGEIIKWEVNGSYAANFSIIFPTEKEVGDDIILNGLIFDANDHTLDGIISRTYLYYENGSVAIGPIYWNCTSGNYQTIISTSDLTPGTYSIRVTFTDPTTGTIYSDGNTLYLSWKVYFHFYNTNDGLGLNNEILKIYINNERIYDNYYKAIAGEVINVSIRDYYNMTMYSNNFTITSADTYLDLGLTFHSYKVCNMNTEYYILSFLKENAARWWEKASFPYETTEFLLPSGNYTFRVYDVNYTELYNDSIKPINNSRGFIIEGANLTEVISGQSIIRGQLLELAQDLEAATTPDIVCVVSGIPHVYSVYETEGQLLGTVLVCPAKVLTAETTNTTTVNETATIFYPLIPDDSVTENGTVYIKEDYIYFQGNGTVHSVNISYNTTWLNLTYIPNRIDLFGENVTVNCTGNMTVTRKTVFQQYWKFYWTKYTETNFYEATVDIPNRLNIPVNKTYIYIEYANDTTPDYITVSAYDVTNGVYLTRGENFDSTATGAHFYIDSINANSDRTFKLSYSGVDEPVVPNNAITIVYDYAWETVSAATSGKSTDLSYYYIDAQWHNTYNEAFIGDLEIQFNFDTEGQTIDPASWIVLDEDNNVYLNRDDFAYHGGGLRISQNIMGTLNANEVRNFKAWFLYFGEEDADTTETQFLKIDLGGGFLVIHAILLALFIPVVGGVMLSKGKKRGYLWVACIFLLIIFLFIMSQRAILF